MQIALKPRLAKIARISAEIAGGLIAFVLILVIACVILNSFDAPLSEQAKALLAAPPNPYPSNENLYLAMAGLEGPGERPIAEMGQERLEAYNQALDSMLPNPDAALKVNRNWDAAKLAFSGKLELGPQRTTSIWTDAKRHRQDIAALLASNPKLYQRYLSLHDLRGYYETARPSYMGPAIYVTQQVRVLFLGDVSNRVQTGTLQQQHEALTDLQHDLQMWRTVLKGDGTLIGKMVAAASLHGDLILLADFIEDPSNDLVHLDDVLGPMLLPSDPKDYRIGNAFAAEFRGTVAVYKTITAPNELVGSMASSSWHQRTWDAFQAHFFKINATENMGAAMAAQWVALGDSAPSQFYLNREAYREWLDQNEPHLSPAFLYNPVGKILVKLAVPQNDVYPLRAFDVAAYQRLVCLLFQLKRQRVATADVLVFLKAHPEWSTHPVDGRTFRWNAETGELAVNTLGEHPKGQRFSVMVR
jgi:hypothetical protein